MIAVLKEDHGGDLRIAQLPSFVVKTYDSLVFYQPSFESRSLESQPIRRIGKSEPEPGQPYLAPY